MKTEIFSFTGSGGMLLPAVLWLPEGEPGAVLQITHGMTEHMGRYEKLADRMDAHGGSRVVEIWSECKFRHLYDRAWFGEGSMMPFEDIEIRMPDKNHEIMSLYYGDYMTLPPEEDRDIQHKMEIVEV